MSEQDKDDEEGEEQEEQDYNLTRSSKEIADQVDVSTSTINGARRRNSNRSNHYATRMSKGKDQALEQMLKFKPTSSRTN